MVRADDDYPHDGRALAYILPASRSAKSIRRRFSSFHFVTLRFKLPSTPSPKTVRGGGGRVARPVRGVFANNSARELLVVALFSFPPNEKNSQELGASQTTFP